MTTLLLTHPSCTDHATPPGHPERPDRIRVVEKILGGDDFKALKREKAPAASDEIIALCHPMDYIAAIREHVPTDGIVHLDGDTIMSPASLGTVQHCVGSGVRAVDEVIAKSVRNAFCAIRPPGHHAETARPMGFCIFNHAAIAARYAQRKKGIERVALVDFDVHHGNGSQEIFWADESVLYASTHQMPLYPGTGSVAERGEHDNIVNAPLRAHDGGRQFREAFETVILPRLRDFAPGLIVISAGFDAHRNDPLGSLELVEDDFAWVTKKLMDVADQTAEGRIVSMMEGGYDLDGLANSAAAHVKALMQG